MGNCLRNGSSSMQWGGDDCGSFTRTDHDHDEDHRVCKGMKMEEQEEEGQSCTGGFTDSSTKKTTTKTTTTTEVKIKIIKKQLEELLGRAELKELSVQQVVAQLMNVSDQYEIHQRSWRPALHSIPEVN